MKSLVNREYRKEVLPEDLLGNEIIAYKCKSIQSLSRNNYAVLARLHGTDTSGGYKKQVRSYGFVPLGESDAKPRYMGSTWKEAVLNASKARELKIFDSFQEMVKAMYEKLF